ncbi:MAG: hypothetical protein ACHQ7N_16820 [Candidatus Methylomirabilales bacterium]
MRTLFTISWDYLRFELKRLYWGAWSQVHLIAVRERPARLGLPAGNDQAVGRNGAGVLDCPFGIHQPARRYGHPKIHAGDDAGAAHSHRRLAWSAARSP